MGKFSTIEWTHHTFNPWWGCTKVSPACKHCYAETWAKRVGQDLWGAKSDRRFFTEAHWKEPLKWNELARHAGERHRVFCASMADVFEARTELNEWRERLWELISKTPNLDWLLLTKRPQRVKDHVPWTTEWPSNVWLGATVESQRWAEERIPELLANRAHVHFLSCEPLLGPVNLTQWKAGVDWVIAGGESGHYARPTHPNWITSLRDQCIEFEIAFHFKQWGHWAPIVGSLEPGGKSVILEDEKGKIAYLAPLGKKHAGRSLDGRTWNELPGINNNETNPIVRSATSRG